MVRDFALWITAVVAGMIAIGKVLQWVYRSWKTIDTKIDSVLYELRDNGGGSFKDYTKREFGKIQEFQVASIEDRRALHEENDRLRRQFEQEIARTKLASTGTVDDRDDHRGETA